jgi:hypothetical protein
MGVSIIDFATAASVASGAIILLALRSRIGRLLATLSFSSAAFVSAARPEPLLFGPQASVLLGCLLGAAALVQLAQLAQLHRRAPKQR